MIRARVKNQGEVRHNLEEDEHIGINKSAPQSVEKQISKPRLEEEVRIAVGERGGGLSYAARHRVIDYREDERQASDSCDHASIITAVLHVIRLQISRDRHQDR